MKKTLLVTLMVMVSLTSFSQKCWLGSGSNSNEDGEPNVTVGVLIDWSLKPLGTTGFTGLGLHLGTWVGSAPNWPNLGVFAGFVESKLNDNTPATREWAATLAFRLFLFDKKIQVVPSFSAGTHNYQDYALRVGYKINDGIYVGLVGGRMMHYGIATTISIFRK